MEKSPVWQARELKRDKDHICVEAIARRPR